MPVYLFPKTLSQKHMVKLLFDKFSSRRGKYEEQIAKLTQLQAKIKKDLLVTAVLLFSTTRN